MPNLSARPLLTAGLIFLLSLVMAPPALAQQECGPLRRACADAGFHSGTGAGSVRACVARLIRGSNPVAGRALPDVPAEALEACRRFRQLARDRANGIAPVASAAAATAPQPPLPTHGDGPNFVFVLVDDFALNLMPGNGIPEDGMPHLAQLMRDGISFSRYFVTNSLCCPSRGSILTGKLPHNSGVLTNLPPEGGYEAYMAHGNGARGLGVSLHAAGYRTAMLGKYLNGYEPDLHGPSPGWTDWAVGTRGYVEYDVLLNKDGVLEVEEDYLTDALSKLATGLIEDADGRPFFLYIGTFAPHGPYIPPKRYADRWPDLAYPRTAAFGARPDKAAPAWLRAAGPLSEEQIDKMAEGYRDRVRADKAVDDLIGAVRAALEAKGLAGNTYVIFTSDNGYHMGEYSLRPGKQAPFDTDVHQPLVVAGPGIAAGTVTDAVAMNIDLYPTFAELSGAAAPEVDGVSLVPLLRGRAPADWRRLAVIEHTRPDRAGKATGDDPDRQEPVAGNPDSYVALRMADALYVEYGKTGERSYYDLAADPHALHNIYDSLPKERRGSLAQAVQENATCKGAEDCFAAQRLQP